MEMDAPKNYSIASYVLKDELSRYDFFEKLVLPGNVSDTTKYRFPS